MITRGGTASPPLAAEPPGQPHAAAPLAGRPPLEQSEQVASAREEIAQGVLIEHREKGAERLAQDRLQAAARFDWTGFRIGGEALGDVHASLEVANHVPELDVLRPSGQPYATVLAADGLNIAEQAKLMNDLHQMVLRDAVSARHLVDRYEPLGNQREQHQHPEGIVGETR